MKPVNIYALTRTENIADLQRLERQMSMRFRFLKIKKWEVDGLKGLVEHLLAPGFGIEQLDFYYSYQLPKLGKEFDLLRINEDKILNIELKSEVVPEEKIKKQLILNRYYLNTLGRNVRSYTYVSGNDKLYRLTKSDRLIEADWDALREDILTQKNCFRDNIEEFIREEDYIISPLAEPDRFLNREYFLTSQQKDIAYHILKEINDNGLLVQGFTGSPGTGKTLLLYDLAMTMSVKQRVAIFHCGSFPEELKRLDERLKRIDFFDGTVDGSLPELEDYSAILVDEAHGAADTVVRDIVDYAKKRRIPVVFSYDCEDVIAKEEIIREGISYLEGCPGYIGYRLTNRIRANAELSSFIHCLMHCDNGNHRREYPNVSVYYAADEIEKERFVCFLTSEGYTYIHEDDASHGTLGVNISRAVSSEYEKVLMTLDDNFYYEDRYLRSRKDDSGSHVATLFHGLSRSKEGLALVVVRNEEVFDVILGILQGK